MTLIKKSFSITSKQDDWLKQQLESGDYGNESEVIRDLIRERQRTEETRLVDLLQSGETSGLSTKSLSELLAAARDS